MAPECRAIVPTSVSGQAGSLRSAGSAPPQSGSSTPTGSSSRRASSMATRIWMRRSHGTRLAVARAGTASPASSWAIAGSRWRPASARTGFARCLTAVEDIPTEAMLAGIDWNWESFPEYLANVDRLPKAINYGAYLGHSALRMYVMGKRALTEKATEDDLTRMVAAVKEAVRAGAMGLSSSRATTHVTPD